MKVGILTEKSFEKPKKEKPLAQNEPRVGRDYV